VRKGQPTAASLGGLALLEALRPPSGFVVDAALGTTYSLDLVSCAAALVSLDGAVREYEEYGRLALLRATTRLRDRVRIVAQQGCIYVPGSATAESERLLDRFVRVVFHPLDTQAFHPKVWLVRQRPSDQSVEEAARNGLIRYVLVVGSRNLTRDRSWDLGVTLEGWVNDEAGVALAGVDAFAKEVCRLGGIEAFAERFADAGAVAWTRPEGVKEMTFGFHHQLQDWGESELATMARETGQRVLWISPFLDVAATEQLATLWNDIPEQRLVAGEHDLDKVSRSRSGRASLEKLKPRAMAPASEAPPASVPAIDRDDVDPEGELADSHRGLHAKVVAIWQPGNRASVLIGSANLSSRGWQGKNVEAWLKLTGRAELADALWDWAGTQAHEYVPPRRDPEPATTDKEALLDRWHHRVAARSFKLYENGPDEAARLEADAPPIAGGETAAVELRVARLTRRGDVRTWEPGALGVSLPGCDASQHSDMLVMMLTLHVEGDVLARSWLQKVSTEPAIDFDARDGAMLRRLLSPAEFLRYLHGLLDPDAADLIDAGSEGDAESEGDTASEPQRPPPRGAHGTRKGAGETHLEMFLRGLVRLSARPGTLCCLQNLHPLLRIDAAAFDCRAVSSLRMSCQVVLAAARRPPFLGPLAAVSVQH
jgi:hypothetical protein